LRTSFHKKEGEPALLVVPTSIQMGWVKSCTATETARDVTTEYTEMPVGTLPQHKFQKYVIGNAEYDALPETSICNTGFVCMVKVYIDNFMSLVIPVSCDQLQHVMTAVMTGIHDIFPPDNDDSNDPILEKKLIRNEGQWSTWKTLLSFDFVGLAKTMWLKAAKWEKLLTAVKGWACLGRRGMAGIPFKEFELVTEKLRHAFTCIPAGVGLLSPCYFVLTKLRPPHVYLHQNIRVCNAIEGCRTHLRESTREPTRCRELTYGWPDFIGIVNAFSHGVCGVIFGELLGCTPMIF
jgi:hypothetical protein